MLQYFYLFLLVISILVLIVIHRSLPMFDGTFNGIWRKSTVFYCYLTVYKHRIDKVTHNPIFFSSFSYTFDKFSYIKIILNLKHFFLSTNCGKQGNLLGRDRSDFLNEVGCIGPYMVSFGRDLRFLCGLAIATSIVYLLCSFGLIYVFNAIRKNQDFEEVRTKNRLLYH